MPILIVLLAKWRHDYFFR